MHQPTRCSRLLPLAITVALGSLGAQPTPARQATSSEPVCSLLTTAEVEKYITRGRTMYSSPAPFMDTCSYGASWGMILVYSGPNADKRFEGHLEAFHKDKEPRFPLPSLGPDGWIMYPRPENEAQRKGAFTHVKVGSHVVGVFVDADEGESAESAKANAEAVTKLVMAKLR